MWKTRFNLKNAHVDLVTEYVRIHIYVLRYILSVLTQSALPYILSLMCNRYILSSHTERSASCLGTRGFCRVRGTYLKLDTGRVVF